MLFLEALKVVMPTTPSSRLAQGSQEILALRSKAQSHKSSEVKVTQSCPNFMTPWTIQSMEFCRPEYWSGQPFPSPGDLSSPEIKPRSPKQQMDSLPAEPQGKPKNTRVGSLFLLQWIFPTQESNRGLLHYRQFLYQLSHPGSLCIFKTFLLALVFEGRLGWI